MRRILVVVAMLPALARAEDISAGTFALGGASNLGFSSSSTRQSGFASVDTTSYRLEVTGLYYAIPNIAFGVNVGWGRDETKVSGQAQRTISTFLFGPAVELDFPQTEQAWFFTRGTIGYVSTTFGATGSLDTTFSGWQAAAEIGAKYFVVNAFSIDLGLAYAYSKITGEAGPFGGSAPTVRASGFSLNAGLSVYFGR